MNRCILLRRRILALRAHVINARTAKHTDLQMFTCAHVHMQVEKSQREPDAEERSRHAEWIQTRSAKILELWRSVLQDVFPTLKPK